MGTEWKHWAGLWANLWVIGTATALPFSLNMTDDIPDAGPVLIAVFAAAGGFVVSLAALAIAIWRRDDRLGMIAAAVMAYLVWFGFPGPIGRGGDTPGTLQLPPP